MNKNKPAIRFKGFSDAWEQRKLGEVVDVQSGKDYKHLSDGDIPVYGTGGYMLSVNKALSYNQDAIGIGRKGTIDKPYVLKAPFWTVDTLFYAIPKDNNKLDFLNCIFQNVDWKKKDESTGVPSLSKSTINDVDIFIPNENEQQSLGEYFCKLDHLITLHQRKYEKLQNVKKSMLEKMFPKNGSKFPEIRFKGFTDAWEQRELGEIFEEYSEKNHSELPPLTVVQGRGTMRRDESDRHLVYDKSSLDNYKLVREGDFIVHLRSFEGGLEVAKSDGIISPAYHTLHSDIANSDFYYPYFRSHEFINIKLINCVYGIRDGRSIDVAEMKKINIPYTSMQEQNKIAACFAKLNHLITLHQRELEKLQNIKKSMLEKMFV